MPTAASFIIPVVNEDRLIAARLRDLRARFPGSELIVVDGGSDDNTVREALPLCHRLLIGDPGRARQMNLGASVAGGEVLVFLHADTELQLSGTELAAALASLPQWGFAPVRLSGNTFSLRVVAWFMNWRSRLTAISTGDQMQFVRADVFESLGGFADIPLMEDVDLSRRLRRLSRPKILSRPVVTSSRRWEERGVASTVLLMWGLRMAYFLGVSPVTLHRYYYGN